MIYKYNSSEFEKLRVLLFNFFETHINDQSLSLSKRKLVTIFYKIFDKSNLNTLHALDDMKLSFNDWDNTDITLSVTSEQNIFLLDMFSSRDLNNFDFDAVINTVFIVLYADFYEASLLCEDLLLRPRLKNAVKNLNENISYLSEDSFKVLTSLWFIIPQRIFTVHLSKHLEPKVLETVRALQDNEVFLKKKTIESEKLISDIGAIQSSLDEQKNAYNFLGLSDGFKTLKDEKKNELFWQNGSYYTLMIIIILLIISKSVWSANYLISNSFDSPIFIIVTISTILFLFILLYFFRISLVNVKSIKSQILQIDLRLTLCRFIHNYNTETAKLRTEDMKESFNKFESVIFAPIVATEDQMPSTFDGLEQLTGILGSFNKGSK